MAWSFYDGMVSCPSRVLVALYRRGLIDMPFAERIVFQTSDLYMFGKTSLQMEFRFLGMIKHFLIPVVTSVAITS
jgi:hypothetical protein